MNFDGIWISPVTDQLPQRTGDGEAYAGYWQQDMYSVNSHFGTSADLQALSKAVHDRGMYLMLDIVVNHMGYAGSGWEVDFDILNPFNDESYFHSYCEITSATNETNVQDCWLGDDLVSLPDVDTGNSDVQQMYASWISGMVSNYSIDGLRIDTAINVEPSFFPDFVSAAGVFATGETMDGDDGLVCQWQNTIGSILNYPIYYPLTYAFESPLGSMNDLVDEILSMKATCQDTTVLGSFSENHDVPRFASATPDMSAAKNIVTYTMLADGIPIIFQGQEQHMTGGISPYLNRSPLWETDYSVSAPLYQHIALINKFRQHVIATSTNYTIYNNYPIYYDYHSIAMRKGFNGSQVVTILSNLGTSGADYILSLNDTQFTPGTQVTEVLTCTNITINSTGHLDVPMSQGLPRVVYPTSLLYGSELCNMPDSQPSTGGVITATVYPVASATSTSASSTSDTSILTTRSEAPALGGSSTVAPWQVVSMLAWLVAMAILGCSL